MCYVYVLVLRWLAVCELSAGTTGIDNLHNSNENRPNCLKLFDAQQFKLRVDQLRCRAVQGPEKRHTW